MAVSSSDENQRKKTFEQIWEINDWANLIKNETLIKSSKIEFQCKADDLEYVKVIAGLRIFTDGQSRHIGFYWKLLSKHACTDNAQIDLVFEELKKDGNTFKEYKSQAKTVIGEIIDVRDAVYDFPYPLDVTIDTNGAGSWVIRLKLTLLNLADIVGSTKEDEFVSACTDEFSQNLASLLNDELGSDVKILTRDKIQLYAHKTILRARCSVFTSMFGSDFLESSTGVITVDDISAKTMEILLRYWYTGKLSPTWKNADIVVEFTYAAGKYQMTHILQMLDDTLGIDFKSSDGDLELLRVVQQLSLKNAEARILKHVVCKINQAQSGAELMEMSQLETNNVDEGKFAVLEVMKSLDDVLSESIEKPASSYDITLMALACKNGMKNVENKLFKRIINTVNKACSADELFALFDIKNDRLSVLEDSTPSDMLVRLTV